MSFDVLEAWFFSKRYSWFLRSIYGRKIRMKSRTPKVLGGISGTSCICPSVLKYIQIDVQIHGDACGNRTAWLDGLKSERAFDGWSESLDDTPLTSVYYLSRWLHEMRDYTNGFSPGKVGKQYGAHEGFTRRYLQLRLTFCFWIASWVRTSSLRTCE